MKLSIFVMAFKPWLRYQSLVSTRLIGSRLVPIWGWSTCLAYHLCNTYLIWKMPPPASVTVHLINWLLVSMRRTRLYSSKGDPFTLCTAEISERQPEQNWKNAINFIGVKLNIPLPKHTPPSWFFFKNYFSHTEKSWKSYTQIIYTFSD